MKKGTLLPSRESRFDDHIIKQVDHQGLAKLLAGATEKGKSGMNLR